jgi:HK97 family phage major capsid protein
MRSAADAPPADLYGTPVVRSAQVSNARVKGSGVDLTYILLGYFPDWIVARLGVMEFLASGFGDTALVNDQTWLRGIQHVDAGPRNAASFVLCDQLVVG